MSKHKICSKIGQNWLKIHFYIIYNIIYRYLVFKYFKIILKIYSNNKHISIMMAVLNSIVSSVTNIIPTYLEYLY